eukprot:GHVL01034131.1.p1 GENE.GHVL01034131.1~~GHVL01034131.1.p1  ORF type:complete len:187 (+),score=35.75 GHVL01034131.1:32-592(+)
MINQFFRNVLYTSPKKFQNMRYISGSVAVNGISAQKSINHIIDTILGTNWGDSVNLVLNIPFWENEVDRLQKNCQYLLHHSIYGDKLRFMNEILDVLACTEDLRDHINELLELKSREGGLAGTGYLAVEPVSNIEEHAEKIIAIYEKLKIDHPKLITQIEDSVGTGIAVLRQRNKFRYQSMHAHFF